MAQPVNGAELAARTTAADAALRDFQRATGDQVTVTGAMWQEWALIMGQHLQNLVQELHRPQPPAATAGPPSTTLAQDGSAWLTPGDRRTVVYALREASDFCDTNMRYGYLKLAAMLHDDRG